MNWKKFKIQFTINWLVSKDTKVHFQKMATYKRSFLGSNGNVDKRYRFVNFFCLSFSLPAVTWSAHEMSPDNGSSGTIKMIQLRKMDEKSRLFDRNDVHVVSIYSILYIRPSSFSNNI